MSSQSILPPRPVPLDEWAKQHLTALVTAKDTNEFNTAFDEFIAKKVTKIIFDGETLTREQYKEKLNKERTNRPRAIIHILDTVQAAKLNHQESQTSGVIGLFYNATYEEGDLSFGAHNVTSSLNIEVDVDRSVVGPVFNETRRVFSLNQVYRETVRRIESSS